MSRDAIRACYFPDAARVMKSVVRHLDETALLLLKVRLQACNLHTSDSKRDIQQKVAPYGVHYTGTDSISELSTRGGDRTFRGGMKMIMLSC